MHLDEKEADIMMASANRLFGKLAAGLLVAILAVATCAAALPAYADDGNSANGALAAASDAIVAPTSTGTVDNGIPEDYKPPIYNSIPAQQFKNVFEDECLEISGIKVNIINDRGDVLSWGEGETVHFRIFNSTTQETEYLVDTINIDDEGYLPPLNLRKNHNYIFIVEDENHQLGSKKYVQILEGDAPAATDGPGAYDYKTEYLKYNRLTKINVFRRSSPCADPFDDNRYYTAGNFPITVKYQGNPVAGVKFKLVSDLETLEVTTTSDGKFPAYLIEDVTYMVYLDSDQYVIDPFPIVAKDKWEYGEGRYCYNHTTCVRVKDIILYDKGETKFDGYARTLQVTSLKGRTTVKGMNFKELVILDRLLDTKVDALEGREYDVVGITAVNPRRWEISKLLGTQFSIHQKTRGGLQVANVYRLENGVLKKLPFTQTKLGWVDFKNPNLSLYPFVIEYAKVTSIKPTISPKQAAYVYNGKTITPPLVVKNGKNTLPTLNYTVSWQTGRKNVGTYKATVKLAGKFKGSGTATFKINPKGTSLSNLKAGKNQIAVTWKKQATQTTGYQLQYCLAKTFKKSPKSVTIRGAAKTKHTIKSLKSGKRYYVRVRTFKKIGNTTYWSTWSAAKNVVVK